MVEGKPVKNFLSPAIILLGIFTFYPLFNTILISFREKYNFMRPELSGGIGIENYQILLKSNYFRPALLNTMIIVFVSVPLSLILSLLISVALNSIKGLKKILQTVFFLPYVTNTIAIGMVFEAMFNIVGYKTPQESVGIINTVLGIFGVDPINWINAGSSYWANIAVLVIY